MAIAAISFSDIAAGTGGFVIYGQDAGDQSGFSVASAGDINGDGFDDLIIGAKFGDAASDAEADAGDSYAVFGKAGGFGASIDLVDVAAGTGGFVIHGEDADDRSGHSVASAGDVNGDGFDDLIIGAPRGDAAGNLESEAGDSYVVFGKASGFGASIDLVNVAAGAGGFVIHGEDAGDFSGVSVASAGDINGDGFDDLIIGSFLGGAAGNAKSHAGDSYVVFGKASDFGASIDLANVAAGTGGFVIHGADAYDYSGFSVASAGDINGDGFDDLIIGAPYGDAAGNAKVEAGDSYVVFGKASGFGASIDLADVAAGTGGFVIHGEDVDDYSGHSVAAAGDINGDGFDDLIIGALNGDAAGNAKVEAGDSYVVFGKASGFGASIDLADVAAGTGGFVIHGQDENGYSGTAVASAGDINGDGFDDLIIGTVYGWVGPDRVSAHDSYVVFGKASSFGASIDLATIAAGIGGFEIHGEVWGDGGGPISVASAGDINGDGFDDLIIGSLLGDAADDAKVGAGNSYVLYGKDFTGTTVTHMGTSGPDPLPGSTDADIMVAGRGNDTVSGFDGADAINGGTGNDLVIGGAGADRIDGGNGRDTASYASSAAAVTVNLATDRNGGGDAAGDHLQSIENLEGSALADRLSGNPGANSISGGGGADVLRGGAGNDTLLGGSGADRLVGGDGSDVLQGGAGNDLYKVGLGDTTTEGSGAGVDTVDAARSWTLGANIERLVLSGTGNFTGTGNALGNVIHGNVGANLLDGGGGGDELWGGAGNDTLTGGAGNDRFVFDGALSGANNLNTVTDFAPGSDKVVLPDSIFGAVTGGVSGKLTDAQFASGAGMTTAQDADDRIIYNTNTGALFYDADGTGAGLAVRFAVLGTAAHPSLGASDILVLGV